MDVFATTTVLLSEEFSETYSYRTAQSKLRKLRLVTGVQFSSTASKMYALHGTWDQVDASNNILTHWHAFPDHEPDTINNIGGKDLSESLCPCLKLEQTERDADDPENESRNDNTVGSSKQKSQLCIYTSEVKRDIENLKCEFEKRKEKKILNILAAGSKTHGYACKDETEHVENEIKCNVKSRHRRKMLVPKKVNPRKSSKLNNESLKEPCSSANVKTKAVASINTFTNLNSDTESYEDYDENSIQTETENNKTYPLGRSRGQRAILNKTADTEGKSVHTKINRPKSSINDQQSTKTVKDEDMSKENAVENAVNPTQSYIKKMERGRRRKKGDKGYWSRVKRDDLDKEHQCSDCGVVLKSRKRYLEHRRRMHVREYKCDVCLKGFGYPSDLQNHRCKVYQKSKTKKHQENEEPHNLSVENENKKSTFGAKESLEVTSSGKRSNINRTCQNKEPVQFECHICQSKFKTKRNELRHLKKMHNILDTFSCNHCSNVYKKYSSYTNHLKIHEVEYTKLKLICDTCGKIFSSRSTLLVHQKNEHQGKKRSYLCQICGTTFSQRTSHKQHTNAHNGIQPYKCGICGKVFSYPKSLKEHMFLHDSIRRFKCNICSKRFRQKTTLHIHSKIHRSKREHVCSVCSKAFTQKQSLERHERIHSGLKPFKCLVCEKCFGDRSGIRRHVIGLHQQGVSSNWRESVSCSVKKSDYYIQGGTGQNRTYKCKADTEVQTSVRSEEQRIGTVPSGINESVVDRCQQELTSTKQRTIEHQISLTNSMKLPLYVSFIPTTTVNLLSTSHHRQSFANNATTTTSFSCSPNLHGSARGLENSNAVSLYRMASLQKEFDGGVSVSQRNLGQYIDLTGITLIPTSSDNMHQTIVQLSSDKLTSQRLKPMTGEGSTQPLSCGLTANTHSQLLAATRLQLPITSVSIPFSGASLMPTTCVEAASVKGSDPFIQGAGALMTENPVVSSLSVQNVWELVGYPTYTTAPSSQPPKT